MNNKEAFLDMNQILVFFNIPNKRNNKQKIYNFLNLRVRKGILKYGIDYKKEIKPVYTKGIAGEKKQVLKDVFMYNLQTLKQFEKFFKKIKESNE